MKTVTMSYPACDDCKRAINDPDDGFVIQGNIYAAESEPSGGIIGNNFPAADVDGRIVLDAINLTCLCRWCFAKALKIAMRKKDPLAPEKEATDGSPL